MGENSPGYSLQIFDNDTLQIRAGSTVIAQTSISDVRNEVVRLWVSASGTTITGKLFDVDGVELYSLTTTDTTFSSGACGLVASSNSVSTVSEMYGFGVGTSGDAAPTKPIPTLSNTQAIDVSSGIITPSNSITY